MTLDELIDAFIASSPNDWNVTHCWGHNSGPSYRDKLQFHEVYNSSPNVLTHSAHGMTASFKPDLSVTIAWGMDNEVTAEEKVRDEWTQNFPDRSGASLHYLDFFFCSALVLRVDYASVDGGRYYFPIPSRNQPSGWKTEQRYAEVMKKLNEIVGHSNFDLQLSISGITIVDESWPD